MSLYPLGEIGGWQSSTPNQKSQALALVTKLFKISQKAVKVSTPVDEITRIKNIFREIQLLFNAIDTGSQYFNEGPAIRSGDLAYTNPGHWKSQNTTDGIWFVKSALEFQSNEFIVDAMIHECAHFVGPVGSEAINHAIVRGKAAYGRLALNLNRDEAFKNASSYAWLAFQARKPSSEWLKGL